MGAPVRGMAASAWHSARMMSSASTSTGLDPALAARAWDVTKAILGDTPLIRVGRPPKWLALYRRDPDLIIDGKAFDGFEIFSRSGQCVLFGIHPETRQPYRWLTDTPATLGPADLPLVASEQIVALIDELSSSIREHRRDTVPALSARSLASPPRYCAR